jgi:hypothetical protein
LSDRGPAFVNAVIRELIALIGNQHVLSMAYSKQENSIVERANKQVGLHLTNIIRTKGILEEWSTLLPLVQRIINSSISESTGVSPAQLLFGNTIDLDRVILTPPPEVEGSVNISKWMDKMLTKQALLLNAAKASLIMRDERHMSKAPTEPTVFPVNSQVLARYPGDGRRPTKLHPRWRGPFRVVNQVGSIVTVQHVASPTLEDIHISLLAPYHANPLVNHRDIALRDKHLYDVEDILGHTGKPEERDKMTFRVHWSGYPIEAATNEPYKNLKDNFVFHEYLRTHRMTNLIPPRFR